MYSRSSAYRRPGLLLTMAIVLAAMGSAGDAGARGTGFEPSQKDFYVYPPYCKAKMADSSDNRNRRWDAYFPVNQQQIVFWRKRIGPDWDNLHSFCAGLTQMSRAKDPGWLRQAKTSSQTQFAEAANLIGAVREQSGPRNPFWQELSLRYAEAQGGAGQYEEAMKVLQELIERDPQKADTYILQADLTERRGDLNAAIGYLEAGLAAGARRGAILYHLANDYYKLGDYERARQYAQDAEQAGMKMHRLRSKLGDE